jgi:hypothetical protein
MKKYILMAIILIILILAVNFIAFNLINNKTNESKTDIKQINLSIKSYPAAINEDKEIKEPKRKNPSNVITVEVNIMKGYYGKKD